MARKPRIHFPGAFYHVILRGKAGQSVFIDDADRCRFYLLMQEVTVKFGCRVHAFCLDIKRSLATAVHHEKFSVFGSYPA
jgi:REP-associated tyrosine transposase